MSQENVEVVRVMTDALGRGDLRAALACLDEEIEWLQPPEMPGRNTWQGHGGVQAALTTWIGAWNDYRYELDELVDCGDRVLARARHHGRGRGSGVEVSGALYSVYTLKARSIVRVELFRDEAKALEAAGLSE
jgi:uncharacterized protein